MKKLFTVFLFATAWLFVTSFSPQNAQPLQQFDWLVGKWEYNIGGKQKITETWKKKDDSTFTGNGALVINGKSTPTEKMQLRFRKGKIIYFAHVEGQPKGVEFTLTDSTGQKWVFENPEHDFPQKITYHLTDKNALHARVEATKKGKTKAEDFYYKRVEGK